MSAARAWKALAKLLYRDEIRTLEDTRSGQRFRVVASRMAQQIAKARAEGAAAEREMCAAAVAAVFAQSACAHETDDPDECCTNCRVGGVLRIPQWDALERLRAIAGKDGAG